MIKIKRVYDKVDEGDGDRILVDRLWPRGLTKSEAQISDWQKTIAPSEKLRKWYAHDVEKWDDFKLLYFAELSKKTDLLRPIMEKVSAGAVTFVFAAKDTEHNNAVALKEYIESGKNTDVL